MNADGFEGSVEFSAETLASCETLSDNLEASRGNAIGGWYHSHPFDVQAFPNWFLSGTDVNTQTLMQTAEDAHTPFLALVVDPLTGLSKGRPEIGAFRVHPASHRPPERMGPDGACFACSSAAAAAAHPPAAAKG